MSMQLGMTADQLQPSTRPAITSTSAAVSTCKNGGRRCPGRRRRLALLPVRRRAWHRRERQQLLRLLREGD